MAKVAYVRLGSRFLFTVDFFYYLTFRIFLRDNLEDEVFMEKPLVLLLKGV